MLIAIVDKLNLTAVRNRIANLCEAYPCIVEECLQLVLMVVANLNDNTRILSKESLDNVSRLKVVEVDVHTALCIGEAHLEQCGDKSTGTDVVTRHNPTTVDKFLNSVEALNEVVRVLDRWNIVANLVEALSKCRTTKTQAVEAEVDMIK